MTDRVEWELPYLLNMTSQARNLAWQFPDMATRKACMFCGMTACSSVAPGPWVSKKSFPAG
jgi:hypothetical protein